MMGSSRLLNRLKRAIGWWEIVSIGAELVPESLRRSVVALVGWIPLTILKWVGLILPIK